jgi:hypothetical membrane protein
VSSAGALVSLVGGWLIAEAVQRAGYDPVRFTISSLARHGADHRWIMTAGLAGIGIGHLVTARLLTQLHTSTRVVLALAGVSGLGLAIFAQPPTGSSDIHMFFAIFGFLALTIWPMLAISRTPGAPFPLRPRVAVTASTLSFLSLLWAAETSSEGTLGLAERLATFQQEAWPLLVVLALRRFPSFWTSEESPAESAARMAP